MTSYKIDLYEILHYLNSKLINWYYRWITVQLGESAIRLFSIYVLKLPLPISLNKNILLTLSLYSFFAGIGYLVQLYFVMRELKRYKR